MPWFRRNGSAVGDVRSQAANQTGIWDLNDAHQLRNTDEWGTVTNTFYYGTALTDSNYVIDNGLYTEVKMSFISGAVPQTAMFAWMYMMDHTPSSVTRWDIYQSNISSGTSAAVSLTNSTNATAIATSLRNGTDSSNEGGWEVSLGCVATTEWNSFTGNGGRTGGILNDNTTSGNARTLHMAGLNNCGGVTSSQWNIRPHIGNSNWGGVYINGGASIWIKVRATK